MKPNVFQIITITTLKEKKRTNSNNFNTVSNYISSVVGRECGEKGEASQTKPELFLVGLLFVTV